MLLFAISFHFYQFESFLLSAVRIVDLSTQPNARCGDALSVNRSIILTTDYLKKSISRCSPNHGGTFSLF